MQGSLWQGARSSLRMPSTIWVTSCSRIETALARANQSCMARTSYGGGGKACQFAVSASLPPFGCGSMMKRMSFSETIFLFFLALIVFGPKKLPEIARQAGKLLAEFRRASNDFKSQIEQEIAHIEVEEKRKALLPASPTPAGTASRTLDASQIAPPATLTENPTPAAPEPTAPASSADLSGDEPLFAAAPTENIAPENEPVTSSTSREPHA